MRNLTTLLISFAVFGHSFAQHWGVNTFSQFTNEAVDVEVDAFGYSYITGYVTGQTAFNATNVVQFAQGNGDIYVAKYDPNGVLQWKQTFGGNFSDRAVDLAIGPDQNVVVTGQFFGTITLGATTLASTANSKDIFLFKMDPTGQIIWAKKEGGNLSENAYGVTVDNQNNILLTGQFQGACTIAGQAFTSAPDPITNLPSFDFFLAKYDANGSDLWSKNGFADYEDRGLAVATDNQNNIFFTGQFSDTLVFAGNTYLNNGFNVGFVSKLTPAGQLVYFNQMKGGMVLPYDLEIDADQDVVITGDFLGNLNYYDASGLHSIQNPYTKQIFVLKTTNAGNYIWNFTLGSNNDLSARAISVDLHQDIFVTGFFKCDLSQIQDSNHLIFNAVGFKDGYLLKLDAQGQREYIKQFGGKMDDEGLGVALPMMDRPIVCGSYTKDLNLPRHQGNPLYNYGTSNYMLHSFAGSETPHSFLVGDSTRNSFLLKYFTESMYDLNYFKAGITDSIPGEIFGNVLINDTIHFCSTTQLIYNTNTQNHYGPSYSYVWNTAATNNPIQITNTNNYSIQVTRHDGCASSQDSIYAISEPIPTLPLLSDTIGINTLHPGAIYNDYHFCYPDSVYVFFDSLAPGTSLSTNLIGGSFTASGVGPFSLHQPGVYNVVASNQYCHRTGNFLIQFDHTINYDSIVLDIVMQNAPNDSISICQGSTIHFAGIDLLTNPNGLFQSLTEPYAYVQWTINGNNVQNLPHVHTQFNPMSSGWYTIGLTLDLGYNNLCGLDTTRYTATKSVYIEVRSLPSWSSGISGDNLLCPNGSLFLVASNPHPNFNWSGPGIIWQNNNDSIEVNAAGTYNYYGTFTGSNGCSNTFGTSFYISLKTAPNVVSQPADGIICPYDSVYMSIPNTFVSYQWIGPNGDSLSTTNGCFGEDQGYYYVHVVDTEGCALTTPPYELREYATPSISVFPDVFLCANETVNIVASYSGNPTFLWSPINATGDEIVVTQPGIYTVSITQCGFTAQDSVEIIDGSFTASISTLDSLLCFDEMTTLVGTPPNASFEWNDGQITGGSYVVNEPGNYSAIVTNEYGCTDITNTVSIVAVPGSLPPSVSDVTICPGLNVSLQDQSGFVLNWFDLDTNLLHTGSQLNLSNVVNDTSFLLAYAVAACAPVYDLVQVTVIDSLGSYQITGDSLLCPGEGTQFSVNTTTESILWSVGNVSYPSVNPLILNAAALNGQNLIEVQIFNQCFASSIQDSIYHITPQQISLTEDTVILCIGTRVEVGLQGLVDSIVWQGNFGISNDSVLILTTTAGTGTITVHATDIHGCLTDTLTLHTIASSLNYQIDLDLGLLCIGDTGSITISGNGIDSLSWTTPLGVFDTNHIVVPFVLNTEGTYGLQLWDTLGCLYQDSIELDWNALPVFDLGTDTVVCINDIYTYYFPNDSNTYEWTTYGGSTSIPILGNQDLILTATSPDGCVFTDTLFVMSVDCNNALPNVITANNDGVNDFFYIDDALVFKENHLMILNRYGGVVYETDDYRNDFQGTDLSEGTYFYVFTRDRNDPNSIKIQGFLELIRN